MDPMRKPFHLDPVFPFELVHKGIRTSGNELPSHLHDLYEAVYIHEGKGMFFIDDALYGKGPGDLFLLPGNTVHRAYPSADEPIVSTAVFFAPSFVLTDELGDEYDSLRCFEIARKKKLYKIELSKALRQSIHAAIEAMAAELKTKEPGYRHAIRLQLQQLLLEINRHPSMKEPASSTSRLGPHWMQNALRTIDRDPVQCGGLAELSSQACISAAHFSRVFKKLTGMSVTEYVNAKRLARAKELLLTTDDNVETIAQACGFLGLPHFYDHFKKMTGLTPRAYRHQGN
ncbi:AraC family transcriptional regulator [Paenibacillus humicola]|uniref:AraC family transcriptional regulator n=1 Tax=Paenibacillus humicola TaxID=3110540 RepID=UPI00237BEA3D|nr:AraC family transcriptional regulator [Paenibacillus humicola]